MQWAHVAPVGLLPVLVFLLALVYLDSYKLVRPHTVLSVTGLGALIAIGSYFLNGWLYGLAGLEFIGYSRYAAPFVEELLKGLVMVWLFRTSRIGFLVDAAILGFAVGAGFALVENFYYLYSGPDVNSAAWVVRGFGTAIMHGGVTAIFGVLAQALTERSIKVRAADYAPGFVVAVVLHSAFNHFPGSPILATAGTLVVLPLLFYAVFQRSARATHVWLEAEFDADAQLLDQLNSGEFWQTRIGKFLQDLRSRFDGPIVADMLCYLRIHTELAIRAKGMLMMRESGLDVPVGERTREKFEELHYLERSIGRTGLLAMKPVLRMGRKDLWQLNFLE